MLTSSLVHLWTVKQWAVAAVWAAVLWALSKLRYRSASHRVWCNGSERKGRIYWRNGPTKVVPIKSVLTIRVADIRRRGEIYDLVFTLTMIVDRLDLFVAHPMEDIQWRLTAMLKSHAHMQDVWEFDSQIVEYLQQYGLQVHVETQKYVHCNLQAGVEDLVNTWQSLQKLYPDHADQLFQIFTRIYTS